MKVFQETLTLPAYPRGFHLITNAIEKALPELKELIVGMLNVFIHHTSAGLTINENADPSVRQDFERHFNIMVPENAPCYKHTLEGPDDMPAHIRAALTTAQLSIPVEGGRLTRISHQNWFRK